METQQIPSPPPGTPGLPVFTMAGRSISGVVESVTTDDPRRVRQPFPTLSSENSPLHLLSRQLKARNELAFCST